MNIKHNTATGDSMFISEMDDSHLINTINLYISKIQQAKDELLSEKKVDEMKRALYGIKRVNKKELGDFIRQSTLVLAPYIMEAMLRGIDFSNQLQELYDRIGCEKLNNTITSLPKSVLAYSLEDEQLDNFLFKKNQENELN